MRWAWLICLIVQPVWADTLVASRMIRPQQIVTYDDLRVDNGHVPGAHSALEDAVGLEARVAIYPGRAIMPQYLGAPAIVDRNQVVELIYIKGGLRIVAEGRALGRAGVGQRLRVMNTNSKTMLFGTVAPNGAVIIAN